MSDDRTRHLRQRNAHAAAAVVLLVADRMLHAFAPTLEPFLVAPTSWLIALAVCAYHHGWLRAHLRHAILDTLLAGPGTALDICHRIGWQAGAIHAVLYRLERDGSITSNWGDAPPGWPVRPRIYQLATYREEAV